MNIIMIVGAKAQSGLLNGTGQFGGLCAWILLLAGSASLVKAFRLLRKVPCATTTSPVSD
ncbi:MAG: hypothetical protein HY921_12675 [Elusimicrobia bacterium]|nr:hypothetical protein [Elusimicrobiota bacterium]